MTKTRIIQTSLDSELIEMFKSIEEMENYIDDFINNIKDMNRREVIVLGAYRASVEYASAIRIMLTTKPMAKVANVLVRSLFGVYIKLEYITLQSDDLYLLEEWKLSWIGHEITWKRLEKFFDENSLTELGNLQMSKIRASLAKATKIREKVEQEIKEIQPDLKKNFYQSKIFNQAKEIDQVHPPKAPEFSLYYSYLILYPYLSASVHLGMDGISTWLGIESKQTIRYNGSGESRQDIKRVAWTTLALLKDISICAMRELDKYDEGYDVKYQAIIDKYNN
jgi:hypothetical protein